MMPAGDAAPPAGDGEEASNAYTLPWSSLPRSSKVIIIVSSLAILIAVLAYAATAFALRFSDDPGGGIVFLAKATGDRGLDQAARSPVIHPSFDLTLRVVSRGRFGDCWDKVTITARYGGAVVGWGTVRDLCVDKRASVEVKANMSHADVVLSDGLRTLMASQLRTGELEFEVEMRMLLSKGYVDRHCESCMSRQGFQLCTVNLERGDYHPCKLFTLGRA